MLKKKETESVAGMYITFSYLHSGSGYNNSNQFTLKREKHFRHYLTALLKILTFMEVEFNKKPRMV